MRAVLLILLLFSMVAPTAAFAECSATDRHTAEQSYSTAYQFVQAGQWAEAIPSLEQAIAACPEHWVSVEMLAQAKMRTKAYTEAADWYHKLIMGKFDGVLGAADVRTLRAYGHTLLQNRNWPEAERVYEAVLAQDPQNVEAHERLVYAYVKSGNTRPAIEHLEALYQMSTGDKKKDYANRIGQAYQRLDDNETAKEWFELSGGATSGMFQIGLDHMQAKQWAEAADSFQKFLEGKPKSKAALKNLGLCLEKLGRKQEAVAALEKALAIDPEDYSAAVSLGILYSELEQWSKAGKLASDALTNWPENVSQRGAMHYLMGKVLEKRDGDYEGAIEQFQKAKSDPKWGTFAVKEIDRQRQLIQIREAKAGQGR